MDGVNGEMVRTFSEVFDLAHALGESSMPQVSELRVEGDNG